MVARTQCFVHSRDELDWLSYICRLSLLPSLGVPARAGAGGKLFGAVTTKEISEGLQKQFGIDIPKQKLVLEDPIKAFGSYQVKAKLGFEVSGTVYVSVYEEK